MLRKSLASLFWSLSSGCTDKGSYIYDSEGSETTFDWFLKPSYLIPILEPFLPKGKETKILMLGCGNSTLGEEMYDAGYKDIVNIDVSSAFRLVLVSTSDAVDPSAAHDFY
jgi:hypothetical protein